MIYQADATVKEKLFPLFADMKDTCILSCLQGHMGQAWVDHMGHPGAAQIIVGDFVFYAGDTESDAAIALVQHLPAQCLVIPANAAWAKRIEEVHQDNMQKIQRYAFRKNAADLAPLHLRRLLRKLPKDFERRKIDGKIAAMPSLQLISPDFTGQFESLEDYCKRGIGHCIMHQGEVVCAASSYSIYNGGIEIEIGTARDYRRKGLAAVAAASLILDCLEQGIYPSWDAANPASAALAQKLGYVPAGAYDAYEIYWK
ncbi:GNAT family N-acetyltransferase [Virgibacillus halophilus]|uniref:GNAT family N-acetyltransferase n=1 Tax=Tigheibacillus halophilus TaxID=361280 RepID=A0ABU5C4J5_9BACI|nr:GNAT family N-acetyltransferase [Virgibacillus halophilus]